MANVLESTLYMALFGIGTIPLMTTAVYIGRFLNHNVKSKIQKAIPVFVIIIGLLFILRGLGLGIPYLSPAPVVEMVDSAIECH
jgi:sulfite exporter TauE/SafE